MKTLGFLSLILGLIFYACNQPPKTINLPENLTEETVTDSTVAESSKDKEEVQILIREMLIWADSKECIDLLPVITDSKNSIYVGFDLDKHKQNLEKLKATNFFVTEFIENYNQIILTLDNGLRNGKYEEWLVGDLPTFVFANGVNPWCLCQDIPYDNPNPWSFITIEIIDLDYAKGELNWKWGNLENNSNPNWKEFKYKFRVVKENNQWKIAYLEGFDFEESTKS